MEAESRKSKTEFVWLPPLHGDWKLECWCQKRRQKRAQDNRNLALLQIRKQIEMLVFPLSPCSSQYMTRSGIWACADRSLWQATGLKIHIWVTWGRTPSYSHWEFPKIAEQKLCILNAQMPQTSELPVLLGETYDHPHTTENMCLVIPKGSQIRPSGSITFYV